MYSAIPLPAPQTATERMMQAYQSASTIPLQIQQQQLQNALAAMQNQYYPQIQNQLLRKGELENQNKMVENEYQPRMYDSDLAYKKAQTGYTNAQAGAIPSEIAARMQQIAASKQAMQYAPLDEMMKAQAMMQDNQRFGKLYQLNQSLNTLPPEARNQYLKDNAGAYTGMLNDLANSQQTGGILTPEVVAKFFPQMQGQMPGGNMPTGNPMAAVNGGGNPLANGAPAGVTPNQGGNPLASVMPPQIANALAQSQQQQAPGQAQPQQQFTTSPDQVEAMQNALIDAANRQTTTAATRRRDENARILDTWITDNKPLVDRLNTNSAKYAGLIGKGKAGLDALANTDPEAYQDYLSFKGQFIPNAINQVKQMEGLGATDSQRKEMEGMFTRAEEEWTANPARAIQYVNDGLNMMNQIGAATSKVANPYGEGTKGREQGMTMGESQPQTRSGGGNMITVKTKDGKIGKIPADKLQQAINDYGVTVVS